MVRLVVSALMVSGIAFGQLPGWIVPKAIVGYSVNLAATDCKVGKSCAEVEFSGAEKPSPFGNVMQSFDATPYRGKRIRYRAAVKVASGTAQMWLRVDRPDRMMGLFDNMDNRPIRPGDWQYVEITGDVERDAVKMNIGMMVVGAGKASIDDVSLDVLGDTPVIPQYAVPATADFGKLRDAAKLWVFVKYLNTRVTMPGVDWDGAFVAAAPKILEAKDREEYAAAVNSMLAALHDPYTRVIGAGQDMMDNRRVPTVRPGSNEVVVVEMTAGDAQKEKAGREEVARRLGTARGVVYDLRGNGVRFWSSPLPGRAPSVAPSTLKRVHYGYASQLPSGYTGYSSVWQIADGRVNAPASPGSGSRPVFLVNRTSRIPEFAINLQESGDGAIVSEDEISDAQAEMGPRQRAGELRVQVRTTEFEHSDGTSELAANVVLNKTGDAAMEAAIEIARSGKWPAPKREVFRRPPAVFTEKTDLKTVYPSTEMRLLAAARVWGVFNYFHPYKYLYGEDWEAVLGEFLPKMAAAKNEREYHLAVAEMVSHTHDSHCFVSSNTISNARGGMRVAVEVRWIENQPVVTRVVPPDLAKSLHPGDVVTKVYGEPVQKRIDELSRAIPASTPQSLMGNVMSMLLGTSPAVTVRGGDGVEREVSLQIGAASAGQLYPWRSGEIFKLLTPKIGYVDLDRLPGEQVDAMFEMFKDTDAIVMDMRGYPKGTAWQIAPRLATSPGMVNAQFRTNVVSTGGEDAIRSEMFEQRIPLTDKPRYRGKTVMLIDERAGSQSEHSGLMYKTANGTVFIGSPTVGANGDVTGFMAPGGIRIPFSGHDVRWPDGKQLQRVGLVPDVEVRPTIAGVRAGRDEVLERALEYLEKGR
jgi:C-terminal processing protease CtpA/Prc